ncbi:MAG: hypothetical protein JOZ83_00375 [Silvibacterium sp.]|nr:hypothetical protein [Silvibacterium sp.]
MADEKAGKSSEAASRFPSVDRLIELASGKEDKGRSSSKEPTDKSMWKLLLQLRPLLPLLTRLVPMLDVAVAPLQTAGLSADVRKTVAESIADSTAKLQSAQRDLNSTVTAALERQSATLMQLEQQLDRLRQANESLGAGQARLREELHALARVFQIAAIAAGILLVALIVMAGVMLVRAGN